MSTVNVKAVAAATPGVLLGMAVVGWAALASHPAPAAGPSGKAPSPTGGRMTQAQAIERARAFCRAIGAPVSAPVTAASPDAEESPSLPPTYWQPCRRIRFGSGAEVAVADSGVVCRYFQPSEEGREPAGAAISRAAVLAKAAAVLAAARVTEPLAPPQAQEANLTFPPQRGGHEWTVIRRRQAQGVAFQDQQATVILQAETGAVIGLGVTFPTPPPAPVTPRLTQAQAVASARSLLAHGAYTRTGFGQAHPVGASRLTWVTPQTRSVTPEVNGVANSPPLPIPAQRLPARLAWICSFGDDAGSQASLPVDVVTGEVITSQVGFSWAPMRLRPRPATPVAMPAPPPAVVDHAVVAATLPGAAVAAPPPNVPRYRLSLTDIYAPFAALTALGFDPNDLQLGGNEGTDQKIAETLERAARDGKLLLVPGPSAVVPEGGVWALTRTREALCKAPIYWRPRPVPARIAMTFSVTPKRQPDGRIEYAHEAGMKALATGESWTSGGTGDRGGSGWSWGDAGAATLLCGLDEERYSWQTGTPGRIQSDGIMHILLVRGVPLP